MSSTEALAAIQPGESISARTLAKRLQWHASRAHAALQKLITDRVVVAEKVRMASSFTGYVWLYRLHLSEWQPAETMPADVVVEVLSLSGLVRNASRPAYAKPRVRRGQTAVKCWSRTGRSRGDINAVRWRDPESGKA